MSATRGRRPSRQGPRRALATLGLAGAARTLLACLATAVALGCGVATPPTDRPGRPRIAVLAPLDLELAPFFEQASITERRTVTWQREGVDVDEMRFWFDVDPRMSETVQRAVASSALEQCAPDGRCAPKTPRLVTGGQGVSGNGFVDNADYRQWIWRTFEASAVDQETAAIAQVAYTNGAPFIAFRGLSDLAGGRDGPNQARELAGLAAGNAARAALSFLKAWEE